MTNQPTKMKTLLQKYDYGTEAPIKKGDLVTNGSQVWEIGGTLSSQAGLRLASGPDGRDWHYRASHRELIPVDSQPDREKMVSVRPVQMGGTVYEA